MCKRNTLFIVLAFLGWSMAYGWAGDADAAVDAPPAKNGQLDVGWSRQEDGPALTGLQARRGPWFFHAGGRLVVDLIRYGHKNAKADGLECDAATLLFEGRYGEHFDFRLEPDLLGMDTPFHLFQAWAAWTPCPEARLKAGLIRVALASEFATEQAHFPLSGYGFASYLDGRTDWGVSLSGSLLDRSLWYEGTVTAGAGFGVEGRLREDPQFGLRAVAHPFRWTSLPVLRGLFGGMGLAYLPTYDDHIRLSTPLDSKVFVTRDLGGDAAFFRHVEVGLHEGPVRLGAERILGAINDVPIGGGQTMDMDQLTAWTFYGAWNITGEAARWDQGRWLPAQAPCHGIGRIELAARYANADIDRNLFVHNLTGYNPSTQEVRTFTLNLNWYPVKGFMLGAGWVKTIADHELSTLGNTNRDSALLLRLALDL